VTGRPPTGAWPLPGAPQLRDELLAAYGDPGRGYHDTRHLAEVLERLDELAAAGVPFEERPVRLAAWFHDAVYDGRPGAEERSARWAERALAGLVAEAEVAEVARLVRLTEHHRPDDGDLNGCALSDADLAVLASGPERYRAYVRDVRREYAAVPDADFRRGRAAVLRALVAPERLYRTDHARARWEAAARRNVAGELDELDGRGEPAE
jgi:predicted metal-dependent HD superfamily phosphohydrolase